MKKETKKPKTLAEALEWGHTIKDTAKAIYEVEATPKEIREAIEDQAEEAGEIMDEIKDFSRNDLDDPDDLTTDGTFAPGEILCSLNELEEHLTYLRALAEKLNDMISEALENEEAKAE